MRNIPVNLSGYKLMVTEEPQIKMRTSESGAEEVVTNFEGETQFVVSLFAKQRPAEGQRAPKGEEIRVTLRTDPGEGFAEGTYVELIDATVSPWQMTRNGQMSAGLAFSANGLKPLR
ncbi:hypothetical protein [Actinoalloteichus spitiensis]|uniref:hypothetical protein n=1 Tax=Actinoalloteichus spitiensis TaxID=252394 RepID=UPI0002E37BAB|nr:hypothetical protein [Actinoalloteichus spitiensis]